MNFPALRVLFRKEFLDLVRDRRTLVSLLLAPMLVGPVMMTGMNWFLARSEAAAQQEKYGVGLLERVPLPGLREQLQSEGLRVASSSDPRADVESRRSAFGIEVAGPAERPTVYFYADRSQMQSGMARGRVLEAIERIRQQKIREELERRNLPESVVSPFLSENVNVAMPRRMAGALAGRLMGFLLLIFLFNGAMYSAVDATAGEKERRTMEILLASAAGRIEIVASKVLLALLTSTATTLLSVISYAVALSQGGPMGMGLSFPTDPLTIVLLVLLVVPVALLAASISVAAATPARSTREAMSYLTPGLFIVMVLGLSVFAIDEPSLLLTLVPFANFSQMLRDVIGGDWTWLSYGLTLAANLLASALAVAAAVRNFNREKILLRT